MNKLFLALSFFCLGLLVYLSVLDPGSSILWIASESFETNLVRVGLMIFLAVLLFTHPPRSKEVRALVGVLATYIALWASSQTYANKMEVLDGLSFLMTAISMAVAVFEYSPAPAKPAAKKARPKAHKPKLQPA